MTGLTATSTSPATTNTAAIAIAPYPASSKRSGTSTSRTPKNNAGSVLSQRPPTNARSRSARAIAPGLGASAGAGRTGRSAAARASATNATATNDPLIPTTSAKPPNIGPTTKPRTARPNTVPSACPRRSRGTSTATHASAPAHVVALEMPWTKRDRPRASGPPESAKARLAIASTVRPARTPRFGPIRPTRRPPGTPPTSDPAPYAPRRRPASSFVRSYVSAK